jgi:Uma2 family endonuclease
MEGLARQHHSFDEYIELEEVSRVKHEFLDGQVWAMAGGSPDHTAIAINIATLLNNALRGRPCRVFGSDLRIRVQETGLGTYPDVTVVCGALELDPEDKRQHTVVNPTLIVEVLSPSTEAYDRGEKLAHYRRIPSLQEILLVGHEERRVDVWRRSPSGWKHVSVGEGEVVRLEHLQCDLPLVEIYRDPLAST